MTSMLARRVLFWLRLLQLSLNLTAIRVPSEAGGAIDQTSPPPHIVLCVVDDLGYHNGSFPPNPLRLGWPAYSRLLLYHSEREVSRTQPLTHFHLAPSQVG